MTHVLLTHAPEDEARAALVAEKLDALGYQVRQDADIHRAISPFERRKLAAAIDKAACVIVLWSREGAETPALRATAERAKASGKLALARLDSSPPPMGLASKAANLANWIGRDQSRAWRQLLSMVKAATPTRVSSASRKPAPVAAKASAATTAPVSTSSAPKKGGAGGVIGVILVLALVGGAAAAAHFVLHLF